MIEYTELWSNFLKERRKLKDEFYPDGLNILLRKPMGISPHLKDYVDNLESDDSDERIEGLNKLSEHGSLDVVPLFLHMLNDPHPHVRMAAIDAAGSLALRLRNPSCAVPIFKSLESYDSAARIAALTNLSTLVKADFFSKDSKRYLHESLRKMLVAAGPEKSHIHSLLDGLPSFSPTSYAIDRGTSKVLSFFKTIGQNGQNGQNEIRLAAACKKGDVGRVKDLLGAKVNPNSRKISALQTAIVHGHADIVELLLKGGADPNIDGRTALDLAVQNQNPAIVNILMKHGAVFTEKDDFGNTILHSAIFHSNKEVVGALLDNGADIESKSSSGHTPLNYAIALGRNDLTEFLLKKGANPNARVRGEKPESLTKDKKIIELLTKYR